MPRAARSRSRISCYVLLRQQKFRPPENGTCVEEVALVFNDAATYWSLTRAVFVFTQNLQILPRSRSTDRFNTFRASASHFARSLGGSRRSRTTAPSMPRPSGALKLFRHRLHLCVIRTEAGGKPEDRTGKRKPLPGIRALEKRSHPVLGEGSPRAIRLVPAPGPLSARRRGLRLRWYPDGVLPPPVWHRGSTGIAGVRTQRAVAIIHDSPVCDTIRKLTYARQTEVETLAAVILISSVERGSGADLPMR